MLKLKKLAEILTVWVIFLFVSCSNSDDLDESNNYSTKDPSLYEVSSHDMQIAIENFKNSSETRNTEEIHITNISSICAPITRSEGGKGVQSLLYAVVVNSKETYFISADKRACAIYATIDRPINFIDNDLPENVPDGLIPVLENALTDISYYIENNDSVNSAWTQLNPIEMDMVGILPRCKVYWDQYSPFNDMCPELVNSQGVSQHCVAGCVAIAAAQALTYLWDRNVTVFNGYKLRSSWDKICSLPEGTDFIKGSDEAIDIANIVYIIGKNSGMKYGLEASGTKTIHAVEFITNCSNGRFKYYASKKYEDVLKTLKGRGICILGACAERIHPTWFRPTRYKKCHAMVVDGYMYKIKAPESERIYYFHVNYGWGKGYNGYILDLQSPRNKFQDSKWVDTDNPFPFNNTFFNLEIVRE